MGSSLYRMSRGSGKLHITAAAIPDPSQKASTTSGKPTPSPVAKGAVKPKTEPGTKPASKLVTSSKVDKSARGDVAKGSFVSKLFGKASSSFLAKSTAEKESPSKPKPEVRPTRKDAGFKVSSSQPASRQSLKSNPSTQSAVSAAAKPVPQRKAVGPQENRPRQTRMVQEGQKNGPNSTAGRPKTSQPETRSLFVVRTGGKADTGGNSRPPETTASPRRNDKPAQAANPPAPSDDSPEARGAVLLAEKNGRSLEMIDWEFFMADSKGPKARIEVTKGANDQAGTYDSSTEGGLQTEGLDDEAFEEELENEISIVLSNAVSLAVKEVDEDEGLEDAVLTDCSEIVPETLPRDIPQVPQQSSVDEYFLILT